jgi:hypothetical protein
VPAVRVAKLGRISDEWKEDPVAAEFHDAPTSIQIQGRTAIYDVDAQNSGARAGAQNSTTITGDSPVVRGFPANFVRPKVIATSGGPGETVQILG